MKTSTVMKPTFRLVRRGTQFYAHSRITQQRESLHTSDRQQAEKLLAAKNDAERVPTMNLALGRVFLAARDAELPGRVWGTVMEAIIHHGRDSTRKRYERAMRDPVLCRLKNRRLIETTSIDLLAVIGEGTRSTSDYLKRLHNYALGFGWLPGPIIANKLWPKLKWNERRAITQQEHEKIVAAETNMERRRFYELLWHVGASQGDAATLTAENVDWTHRVLRYQRIKLKENAPPACVAIGPKLEALLRELPSSGPLFPTLCAGLGKDRAKRFKWRCARVGITGVSLHSYRYAWAERAFTLGMPERFAMANLGHSSTAVHRHYARKAHVIVPTLESYEKAA
jgi:integrase